MFIWLFRANKSRSNNFRSKHFRSNHFWSNQFQSNHFWANHFSINSFLIKSFSIKSFSIKIGILFAKTRTIGHNSELERLSRLSLERIWKSYDNSLKGDSLLKDDNSVTDVSTTDDISQYIFVPIWNEVKLQPNLHDIHTTKPFYMHTYLHYSFNFPRCLPTSHS
jgi:hypothetical protein